MLERLRIITSWPRCTDGLAKWRTAAKLWIRSRALRKRRVTWKKCGEISPIAPVTRLNRRANATKTTPRAITAQNCCSRAPMKGHLGRDPRVHLRAASSPHSLPYTPDYARVSTRLETDAGGKVCVSVPDETGKGFVWGDTSSFCSKVLCA